MTNEQTLILLLGLRDELNTAIEEARANVIAALDRPPVTKRRHRVMDGMIACNMFGMCQNPEHFEEVEEDADMTELWPIEVFVKTLDERIDVLRRPA